MTPRAQATAVEPLYELEGVCRVFRRGPTEVVHTFCGSISTLVLNARGAASTADSNKLPALIHMPSRRAHSARRSVVGPGTGSALDMRTGSVRTLATSGNAAN